MSSLAELLQRRSPVLCLLAPEQTVAAAVDAMAERQIGAVAVVEEGRLIGIFSERDLLRRVIAKGRAPAKVPLREVMTPDPKTAKPGEERMAAIAKMASVGCRHLPILADGVLIDMLSMRDLLFDQIAEREAEVDQLREYIRGS